MKAIAAMDENRGIGKDRQLPWPIIKEDFRFFKEFTTNKILIVGHNTFNTLPPLRNRNIVILTKYSEEYEEVYDPVYNYAYCYRNFQGILDINDGQPNLICAGGAKTYQLFLPYITEFYVTHVKGIHDADTFMPPFEHLFTKQDPVKEFDGHHIIRYSK